jgi:hypothetical protein
LNFLRRFRIPDFPLGALLATVFFSISLLFAFPDLPTAWLWQLTVAIGIIVWALGAGWFAGPSSADHQKDHREETEPSQKNQYQGPISRDFMALINAISAQAKANRAEERREDKDKRSREIITIALIGITGAAIISQVIEMRRVYEPIRQQAETSSKQLIISARPWIGLTDEVNGIITSPLEFDAQGNAHLTYRINVKNYSASPAQNVFAYGVLMISKDIIAVKAAQDIACGENYIGNKEIGYLVFQGKTEISEFSNIVFAREKMVSPLYDNNFIAWFVGCIGYRDQFMSLYKTKFRALFVYRGNQLVPVTFSPTPNSTVDGMFLVQNSSVE